MVHDGDDLLRSQGAVPEGEFIHAQTHVKVVVICDRNNNPELRPENKISVANRCSKGPLVVARTVSENAVILAFKPHVNLENLHTHEVSSHVHGALAQLVHSGVL